MPTQTQTTSRLITVARWLAVLPAAMAAATAAFFLAFLWFWIRDSVTSFSDITAGRWDLGLLTARLFAWAVGGAVFVCVGALTAPQKQRFVAALLAGVWMAICLLLVLLSLLAQGWLAWLLPAASGATAIATAHHLMQPSSDLLSVEA